MPDSTAGNLSRCCLAAISVSLALAPSAGAVDPPDGELLWREVGESGDGWAAPVFYPRQPRARLGEIDAETEEQVARLRARLFREGAHPKGPGLKFVVPLDPAASNHFPETQLLTESSSRAPNDLVFFKNVSLDSVVPPFLRSTTNEPTVAARGGAVFFTGNWYAASSSDGGQSFAFLNPFVGPYAAANDGFCCDQTSVFDPGTDTLFFLQQYLEDGSTSTQRINVDRGFDGVFDCHYDFTPQQMGFGPNNWADFPDLAISNNNLYHASNVFSTVSGSFTGAFAARYPLGGMSRCEFINWRWYNNVDFASFRFTRGATSTMYFADHISNNSLRIWTWPEVALVPTAQDRTSPFVWSNATRVCPGPDGRDWCGFIDKRILGAYVANGVVGFMWVPAQDGLFPFPYTRIARYWESGLVWRDEPPIWSTDLAFTYPSVAVNSNGDLGGTVMFGGGATFLPGCAAWLADDVNGDNLAPVDLLTSIFGTTGPAANRSGDYTMTRPSYPNTKTYVGACFAYLTQSSGSPRFVHFGREKDAPTKIFSDGFESGDASRW